MLRKASDIIAAVDIITNPLGVEKVGFTSRPFVITAFPAKPIKGFTWVRKNGNATLMIAVPDGSQLPYGMDRLIPIFLATKAVKTRSRVITFESAAEVLDLFGLSGGGINYKRLTASLERVFKASVFFQVDSKEYRQQARFHFISGLELWKKEAPTDQPRLPGLPKNKITLSQDFFEEILKHPIPLDIEVVKLLRNKPVALDAYMFIAYKAASIRHTTTIPLSELSSSFGSDDKNKRKFRMKIKKIIETVTKLSGVVARVDGDAIVIEPSRKSIRGK
jgi:hypothetical protein